jgi:hypothetical protein
MREMPVYALVEGKGGIRLQELSPGTPNSTRTDPASGNMEMIGTLDLIGQPAHLPVSMRPGPDDSDAADGMPVILAPMGLKLERRKPPKEVVVV